MRARRKRYYAAYSLFKIFEKEQPLPLVRHVTIQKNYKNTTLFGKDIRNCNVSNACRVSLAKGNINNNTS